MCSVMGPGKGYPYLREVEEGQGKAAQYVVPDIEDRDCSMFFLLNISQSKNNLRSNRRYYSERGVYKVESTVVMARCKACKNLAYY